MNALDVDIRLVHSAFRLEAKFRKPATGRVSARSHLDAEVIVGWTNTLIARGRLLASVPVDVVDESGGVAMSAVVEWFIIHGDPTSGS